MNYGARVCHEIKELRLCSEGCYGRVVKFILAGTEYAGSGRSRIQCRN